MPNNLNDNNTVTIEKLVYEGHGLGRLESGQVVLVPWSVPEDTLNIEHASKKPFATIQDIIQKSPNRIEPQCSVFGDCGGCHWQNMTYDTQLKAKENIVIETLERVGKIKQPPVLPIIGSNKPFEYRNHVVWHWDGSELGYYAYQSNNVIAFTQCHLVPEAINNIYKQLPAILNSINTALEVDIKWSTQNEILLTFMGEEEPKEYYIQKLTAENPNITGICYQNETLEEVLFGTPYITEIINGNAFQISAGSFFQVNNTAVEQLVNTLEQWLKDATGKTMLDAYAGVGLFSIMLNKHFTEITAVESAYSSFNDALNNIQSDKLNPIYYINQEIEDYLLQNDTHWDISIVDPPRGGCSPSVLNSLNARTNDKILYVSCNPTTLARDLKHLLAVGNWKIEAIQPFDFFPQTYHIETAVLLNKIV